MSSFTGQTRQPGSFSPVVSQSTSKRPPLRRVESSDEEEIPSLAVLKSRPSPQNAHAPPRPFYAQAHANSSTGSLQNFSRPTTAQHRSGDLPLRNAAQGQNLPVTADSGWQKGHERQHSQPQSTYEAVAAATADFVRGHGRKHSQNSQVEGMTSESTKGHSRRHSKTQGSFEPFLPTAANSDFGSMANTAGLNTSQIAAQAAMQQQSHHSRQRSQTVPTPSVETGSNSSGSRRPSKGPNSPPGLTLTEASVPRDHALGGQVYHNGLLGGHQSAAQTAANAAFPKSPGTSPSLPPHEVEAKALPEKPLKTEKSKVKLFSRPGKIGISKDRDPKSTALPSPSKLGQYTLASLKNMNMSTTSVAESSMSSASSMYSLGNSSTATIRAVDQPPEREKGDKEKHKHHFLSRQKHKLSSKDDHHLPLSSASSNSRPTDPTAPSSLYNFNLPPSPGPSTTSFAKSMSGLDLRHGGKALREKKKEEKAEALRESEMSFQNTHEWPGPSSLGSGGASYLNSNFGGSFYSESLDSGKYGLNNMGPDDAWPFLKAKLLILFEGEDLRLPVEDFNRLVSTHMQRSIQKRTPSLILDDLRDLLATGFASLDHTLRRIPDERIIPHLVEMWLFTFTSILPYMQAVFLPLDLEFSGNGSLLTPDQAHDFWSSQPSTGNQPLEVRRLVLTSFRDCVILPRFETLKQIFSRLSLDSLPLPLPIGPSSLSQKSRNSSDNILGTSPPDSNSNSMGRPGTAMSLDPSTASYSSNTTTLLGAAGSSTGSGGSGAGNGSRSRAISNTSTRSDGLSMPPPPPPPAPMRPFTPSSTHPSTGALPMSGNPGGMNGSTREFGGGRERGNSSGQAQFHSHERNVLVEDSSKRLTETVGRMLQCFSVLASVSSSGSGSSGTKTATGDLDEQKMMQELVRALKLNWLGRGRMGRNRRGLVGGRVNLNAGSGASAGIGRAAVEVI